ncbi:hypothetical protein D3C72_2380010 [compost metagenome]
MGDDIAHLSRGQLAVLAQKGASPLLGFAAGCLIHQVQPARDQAAGGQEEKDPGSQDQFELDGQIAQFHRD